MGTLETKSGSADIGASPNFPNRLYGLRVWTRYTATEEDQFPGRLVRVGLKKRGSQPIKEHSECGPIYMVLTRVGAERLEGSIALEPGMGVVLGPVPRREEMHRQGKPGMQGRTLYALLQEFENRYPREPERVHVALTYPLPPSETKRAAERRRWQSVVRILEEIQVRYDLPEEWEPTPLDDKTLNDNAREVMLARIRILSYICNYKGQACIAFQSLQSPKEEENDAEDRTGITSPETERVIALYQRSNDLALLDDDHMIYLLGYR